MKRFKFGYQEVFLLSIFLTALPGWGALSCKDLVLRELSGRGFAPSELFKNFRIESPQMWEVVRTVLLIPDGVPVLIVGETGVGKEHVARLIHEVSSRRGRPYVVLDSGALSKDLVLSTLFGHEKGAFTGAHRKQAGLLSEANRGTFFLDEIISLPSDLQHHFLRVLQEKVFRVLGSNEELRADFRLISATNKSPEDLMKYGFREDLYYRLAEFILVVPPLKERLEDIPVLAAYFLDQLGGGMTLSEGALQKLLTHSWPGNVRELRHVVIQGMVNARRRMMNTGDVDGGSVRKEILSEDVLVVGESHQDLEERLQRLVRTLPSLPAMRDFSDLAGFLLIREAVRREGSIKDGAAAVKSGNRTAYRLSGKLGRPLKPPPEPNKPDTL